MTKLCITKDIKSKLKHIDTENLKLGKYDFPDFLIIGPQRTGTSWLQRNLKSHPKIFMPPEKELFFFSNLVVKYSNMNYSSNRLEWYSKKFSNKSVTNIIYLIKESIKSVVNNRNIHNIPERYLKYFNDSLIKGEATASYAAMDETLIKEIITLNPMIKVIMFIRHPYDRAWSHAKKDLIREKRRSFEDVTLEEFKEFFSMDYQIRCGKYTEIIQKWRKFVKKADLFIGNFDDIMRSPEKILKDVFNFLCVSDSAKYINYQLLKSVINPTAKKDIPDGHKEILKNLFSEEIIKLNNKFGLRWKIG